MYEIFKRSVSWLHYSRVCLYQQLMFMALLFILLYATALTRGLWTFLLGNCSNCMSDHCVDQYEVIFREGAVLFLSERTRTVFRNIFLKNSVFLKILINYNFNSFASFDWLSICSNPRLNYSWNHNAVECTIIKDYILIK